jgi:hypothetical protein
MLPPQESGRAINTKLIDAHVEGKNPFSAEHSGYGKVVDGKFISAYPQDLPMQRFHSDAASYFKGLVGQQEFPCLAGRTVAITDQYAFCAYPAMLDSLKSEGKFHQLREAIRRRQEHVHPYLGDHGDVLEWRQYALLEPEPMTEGVELDVRRNVLGTCPFQPKET